jgi:hypothetical protein
MLKLLPIDELFPADAPERLIALHALIPKVVRALKIDSKEVQALSNMKRHPLPFEFTPEHEAMFEILMAMMVRRRSCCRCQLGESLSPTFSVRVSLRIRKRHRLNPVAAMLRRINQKCVLQLLIEH